MQDYQILLYESKFAPMEINPLDLDEDGYITGNDVILLEKYTKSPSSVPEKIKNRIEALRPDGFKTADINKDKKIDENDYRALLRIAANLEGSPYENELDYSRGSFKDFPVCELGSSTSNFGGKAIEPILSTKIDGTHELKFSLPSIYFDENTGKMVDNEIVRYIANKSRIRLKKKNKKTEKYDLYVFVVNTKTDRDNNGILHHEYACTDAYIEELSKTGYGIMFSDDVEFGNGLDTIHGFADKILEDSDWTYRADKTGTLLEYTTDLEYNIEQGRYDTVYKPVPVHPIKYIKQLGRYCNKLDPNLTKGDKQYYCYEDTQQITSNTVRNILYNSNEPIDIVGWTTYKKNSENTKILPGYELVPFDGSWDGDGDGKKETHYGIQLQKKAVTGGTYLLNDTCASSNTTIKANQPYMFRFTTPQEDRYDMRVRAIHIYDRNPLMGANIQPVYKWSLGTSVDGNGNHYYFKPATNYVLKTNVSIANPYFAFYISVAKPSESGGTANKFSFYTMNLYEIKGKETRDGSGNITATAEENNLDLLSTLIDKMEIPSGDARLKKMCGLEPEKITSYTEKKILYFYVNGDEDDEDTPLEYVKFEDICDVTISDKDKDSFSAGGTPESNKVYKSSSDKRYYQYYTLEKNGVSNSVWDLALYGDGANDKRRTLNIEKSNRFNLLQELAELFKAWCVFNIEENPDGSLKREVWFKENAINENFAGFHKGVNLQSLDRTSNSDNIVTKLYVEDQENDYAENGFVTIRTSSFNPWGENYFYNFKYYVDQGFLPEIVEYQGKKMLRVDRDTTELYNSVYLDNRAILDNNEKLVQLKMDLSNLNTQITSLGYCLATATERIASMKTDINSGKLSAADKDKLEKNIKTYESQQKTYQDKINALKEKVQNVEKEIDEFEEDNKIRTTRKKNFIKNFERQYLPYIKEGVWSDNSYVDNDTYMLDSQKVSNTSAIPVTNWTITVLDGSVIEDLENYIFEVGDKTFLIDNEFFYDNPSKEYRFEVLISGIEENLENGLKNKIEVRNYLTSFEDIFQRISAATQTLELKEHVFDKADYFTSDHQIDQGILQNTLANNSLILANSSDNSYTLDNTGLTLQSVINPAKKVRLVADGLFFSNSLRFPMDVPEEENGVNLGVGEPEWKTGITADGINASVLTAGEINTSLIKIYDGINPKFSWGDLGLTAYQTDDANSFLRLDAYGLYYIENETGFNYDADGNPWYEKYRNNDGVLDEGKIVADIVNNSTFSLTRNGLHFNFDFDSTPDINISDTGGTIQLGYLENGYGLQIKDTSNKTQVRLANKGINTIAGWNFTSSTLYSDYSENSYSYRTFLQTSGNARFGVYRSPGSTYVYNDSTVKKLFYVTKEGLLHAENATITGTITATDGKIGNWNIDDSRITTSRTVSGVKQEFYLASASATSYTNWLVAKNGSTTTFQVTKDGVLKASGAEIEGSLSLETNKAGLYFSSWLWSGTSDYFAQLEFQDKSTTNRTGIIADWSGSQYNYHINYIYKDGNTFSGKARKIFSIKKNSDNVAEITFNHIYAPSINTDLIHLTPGSKDGRGTGYDLTTTSSGLLKFGSHRVGHAATVWSGYFYSGANEKVTVSNGVITNVALKT